VGRAREYVLNFYPNIDRKGRVEIIISTPAATERRLAYEASEEYKMIKARKTHTYSETKAR